MLHGDIVMLDTATSTWQLVAEGGEGGVPRRRRHAVARGSGTRLLYFGGWDGRRAFREISLTCTRLTEKLLITAGRRASLP